jgi:hypothetical protein
MISSSLAARHLLRLCLTFCTMAWFQSALWHLAVFFWCRACPLYPNSGMCGATTDAAMGQKHYSCA